MLPVGSQRPRLGLAFIGQVELSSALVDTLYIASRLAVAEKRDPVGKRLIEVSHQE